MRGGGRGGFSVCQPSLVFSLRFSGGHQGLQGLFFWAKHAQKLAVFLSKYVNKVIFYRHSVGVRLYPRGDAVSNDLLSRTFLIQSYRS